MDEDTSDSNSLGMYENMEGYESGIRPDFLSDNSTDGEEDARGDSERGSKAKTMLRDGERTAVNKGLEAGVNAATGGVGGSALRAAEKAGENRTSAGNGSIKATIGGKGKEGGLSGKSANLMGMIKKSAPLIFIIALVIFAITSFSGQWLFPDAFRNREREDNNSTVVSTNNRSDALLNNTQLYGDEISKYGDVVFNDMQFSKDQIRNFEETGLYYRDSGGERALLVGSKEAPQLVVVSDKKLGLDNGEQLAEIDGVVSDEYSDGSEMISLEERKTEILARLDIAADAGSVVGFTEAMEDWNFKRRYIVSTQTWRGDISGWFNESQEITQERTATSRDNFHDFVLSDNNEENETAFLEMAAELNAAEEESDVGDKSLKERVKEVAEKSKNPQCGASSAAADIEGVLNADQTARQVSASSLMMEAIDKTLAGAGDKAPLTAIMNIFVRSGAADTGGIHDLFGSGDLDQGDENLLSVSSQANIGGNGTANLNAGNNEEIRSCFYEGNTNEYNGDGGVIVKIGSMFKRIGGWIRSAIDGFKNLIGRLFGNGNAGVAEAVLKDTVEKYEENKELRYFTGEDTNVLGEAMRNATEKMYGEHAKGAGQTTGDAGAAKLTYRAHQEVIAEQAEFDQKTKNPFDVTSQHTFLGSIAYSLIPTAMSAGVTSLTSMVGNISNVIGNAASSLLPTSSAVSETGLQVSQGDCPHSNSVVAVSNAYCNDYYNSDLAMGQETAVNIYDTVVELRYDTKGYVYRNEDGGKTADEPDYGDGPINPIEDSLSSHWGEKGPAKPGTTPHGCESDWKIWHNPEDPDHIYYDYDEPIEWSYSRATNFEYDGYESGWRNRKKGGIEGMEDAKNDDAPGECVLDLSIDERTRQPVINLNGALAQFLLASGQRTSEWGATDDSITERLTEVDFTKGRLHPCAVGADVCQEYETKYGWTNDQDKTAASAIMSRWIGGTAYVYYTQDIGTINTGLDPAKIDELFRDPTMNDEYFWEENKWYQAYVEILEWMEAAQIIKTSSSYEAVARYYKDNPLDNSYEGIIARYSGMSKERVAAVVDLFQYVAFLAKYDPTDLYPLPAPQIETIQYDNGEIVAQAEQVIQTAGIVYDELRNRTIAV